jgi:hypothetical protein
MPLEFGSLFNSCSEWISNNRLVNKVIGNPLFTALLVTALAMIVVWSLYKQELKDTGKKRALRAFIYVSFAVSALLFVHYYIVTRNLERDIQRRGVREVFQSVHASAEMKGTEGAKSIVGAGVSSGGAPRPAPRAFAPPVAQSPPTEAAAEDSEPEDNIATDEGSLNIEEVVLPKPRVAQVVKK